MIISGLFTFIISITFFPKIFEYTFKISASINYAVFVSLSAFVQSFFINLTTVFRAQNKIKVFTVFTILLSLTYLIVTYIFLTILNWGIGGVFLAQIFSYLFYSLIIMIVLIVYNGFNYRLKTIKEILVFGIPLTFARSGELLFGTGIVYLLGFLTNLTQVGLYTFANKITSIIYVILLLPFQFSFEPFLYSRIGKGEINDFIAKIITYLYAIFIFLSIFLMLGLYKYMSLIAPKSYEISYVYIQILLISFLFRGLQVVSQSIIHINNKTNITGFIFTFNTLINIGIGYFAIKYFGIWGGILITNFYWVSIAFFMQLYLNKKSKLEFENSKLLFLSFFYLCFNLIFYFLRFSSTIFYGSSIILLLTMFILFLYSPNFDKKEKDFVLRLPSILYSTLRNSFPK
jgi:O-antigen/teichoic acid export membrane protein